MWSVPEDGIIAQAERAASGAGDGPEQWLLLGQLLCHYGAAIGRTDWAARSAAALDRAIVLDSTFTLAIGDRLYTAIAARDRDATARFSRLFEARVASGFADDMFLWAAARSVGDSAAALRWRDRREGLSRTDYMQKLVRIVLHSATFSVPLADARWAAATLEREATTPPEHVGAALGNLALRFAEGRSDLGDAGLAVAGPQWVGTLVQQTLIEPAYRPLAAKTLADEAAGRYRLGGPTGTVHWPPTVDCFATLHRVTGGDTIGAAAAIRRLHAFAASERPLVSPVEWVQMDFRVCPLLLQVLIEGRPSTHEPRPSLDRLDSLVRGAPRGFAGAAHFAPTAFATYTIARFREAQGDMPAALAAIRRRDADYFPAYLWSLPAFLRQEGRLAAIVGDTMGAIRAYDDYLTLRTAPDAPFRAQRDSVLAERAALTKPASK